MSLLTEDLPEYVIVRGEKCYIKTDFRVWLEFSKIVGDGELGPDKLVKLLRLLTDKLPPNLGEFLYAVFDFYTHTKETERSKQEKENERKKSFDFDYDAELIYAAFMQQYKIDLTEAHMHWWKFKALLSALSEDTQFMQVVKYRSIRLSDIKDKEQRKFYSKMKSLYKLPDNRNEEQKEADLISAFEKLF